VEYVREFPDKHGGETIRTQFGIDADRILHCKLFNRLSDKTQVFSFYRHDDITRRATHVQYVSKIARSMGRVLGLDLDLIEAISLGHDIGHTPFGHKGEMFLNELYFEYTGKYFNHNVHSVRALRQENTNLTLQTLDGILCHCGERAFLKYVPEKMRNFQEFNKIIEDCYTIPDHVHTLRPCTLEGCIVRVTDMIAYAIKDRQDAQKAGLQTQFTNKISNTEFITEITEDIIRHSKGKAYIAMSPEMFRLLQSVVKENNEQIYQSAQVTELHYKCIKPMMRILYERFRKFEADDAVVDYIASMTDDYFIDLFRRLYPRHELNKQIKYVEYFDKRFG
jgi:dGTPase